MTQDDTRVKMKNIRAEKHGRGNENLTGKNNQQNNSC